MKKKEGCVRERESVRGTNSDSRTCVRQGARVCEEARKFLGRREKFVLNKQRITEISTFLTCRSLCLSVCLSVCSSVCLSVRRLSVCLSVCVVVPCVRLCLMCLRRKRVPPAQRASIMLLDHPHLGARHTWVSRVGIFSSDEFQYRKTRRRTFANRIDESRN